MGQPRLTSALPGAGGTVKALPEDFIVEEVPAYPPSGTGEHLFLWVEKKGHDTPWVARRLAESAGLPEGEVSYAGLKDRQAVTRQLFSLPARAESRVAAFSEEGVQVLWAKRHTNKLRSGHLRGNRFWLRLRSVRDVAAGEAIFARLCQEGVPNYFGVQRFGAQQDNAKRGKALVLGQRLPRAPTRFERRLYLSAYQAELFNRLLAARIERKTFDRALAGDVLRKEESGGVFRCEAPEVDQPRVDAFEISPAGPLFGPKLFPAGAEVQEQELALLASEQVALEDFARGKGETEGARRTYRVKLGEPLLEREGQDLLLVFTLPAGSYATEVLEEVVKPGDLLGP